MKFYIVKFKFGIIQPFEEKQLNIEFLSLTLEFSAGPLTYYYVCQHRSISVIFLIDSGQRVSGLV